MKTEYIKETARDLIALGSPVFFIIVLARIFLLSDYNYLSQFIIGALIFFPLMFLLKANMYSGLGLIVLIFTTLFYNNLKFTIFGIAVYLTLLISLIYLKYDKKKVIMGATLGAISTAISYYSIQYLF